jgi:hypothetical protein
MHGPASGQVVKEFAAAGRQPACNSKHTDAHNNAAHCAALLASRPYKPRLLLHCCWTAQVTQGRCSNALEYLLPNKAQCVLPGGNLEATIVSYCACRCKPLCIQLT